MMFLRTAFLSEPIPEVEVMEFTGQNSTPTPGQSQFLRFQQN